MYPDVVEQERADRQTSDGERNERVCGVQQNGSLDLRRILILYSFSKLTPHGRGRESSGRMGASVTSVASQW